MNTSIQNFQRHSSQLNYLCALGPKQNFPVPLPSRQEIQHLRKSYLDLAQSARADVSIRACISAGCEYLQHGNSFRSDSETTRRNSLHNAAPPSEIGNSPFELPMLEGRNEILRTGSKFLRSSPCWVQDAERAKRISDVAE